MHEIQEKESVVLRVSVSLETLAGERIAEIKTDHVFRDMLGEHALGSAEAALHDVLETQVVSPCRGLIRAHVQTLQEQAGFTRLDHPVGSPLWDRVDEILAALQRRVAEGAAEADGR